MQVNLGQPKQEAVQVNSNPEQGKVVLATNFVRSRVMLDKDGNEIDPRTKQIIKQADENK